MKKNIFYCVSLSCILMISFSCRNSNRFVIDTNDNRYDVKIHRFDKDLIELDTTQLENAIDKLHQSYPSFLPIFTYNILETPDTDKTAIRKLFLNFLRDSTFSNVNKKVLKDFENISDIEKKVSDAYTYIHHYFPEITLPEVYFFVSGFNRSVMLNENFIAFGTDMYLGSDFAPYKEISYKYLLNNMRRECLPIDIVSTTLFRMFVMNSSDNRLIDNMIFRGKVMYLLSVCMPQEKPYEIIGFTEEQLNWSIKYEKDIWLTIVDKKDLFSTDMMLIRKYMNEAPFTAPISQESPGRLGTWIGWKIVESYMNKNTEVTLRNLMDNTNALKILEESGYNPK